MKSELVPAAVEARRHSPHGECGLKSSKSPSLLNNFASLPARGVWVEISSPSPSLIGSLSLPARGVWVEIWHRPPCRRPSGSHSPHGECGLKFLFLSFGLGRVLGHSPHGECGLKLSRPDLLCRQGGHSPHGECGLKFRLRDEAPPLPGHSPHGECGLKLHDRTATASKRRLRSLPARGVWVEMATCMGIEPRGGARRHSPHGECGLKLTEATCLVSDGQSLPARGVWVEIRCQPIVSVTLESLPARGVWVEIFVRIVPIPRPAVTPRTGSAG